MKNLNKETFHWLGFSEIKDLGNTPVKQIKKFTFAPFTPCFLYPLFRRGWDFLTIQLFYHLVFFVYLTLSYIRIGNFWQKFIDLLLKAKISQSEIDAMKNVKNLDSAFGPMGRWRYFGSPKPLAITNIIIYCLGFLALMVFAGIYSRQLSWNRNKWKNFDEFIQSENKWNRIGFIFMALTLSAFIFNLVWMIVTP